MDKQFQVALFDLDGTLINTEGQYTEFWHRIGEELGTLPPDFAQVIKGRTLVSIFQEFFPTPESQQWVLPRLDAFEAQMQFPFYPGVLSFLSDIRSHGVRCAVVTSSNHAKMAAVRRRIPDFDRRFDRVLTAEDFTASKPHPDCYLHGAEVFQAQKQHCVVFEDAINGLQAGVSAGMFTIGFATGNPRSVIAPLCHHVEDDFLQLSFERVEQMLTRHWSRQA